MNTINLKLYDTLRKELNLSEEKSRAITQAIEEAVLEETKGTTKDAATKEDIYKFDVKIEQTKNDVVKWMFGFWVILAILILANWFFKK